MPSSAAPSRPSPHAARLRPALERFVAWFDGFGETSQDHQDFFASVPGRAAKSLYYRQPLLGKAAVLPMVACEAFLPDPPLLPRADAAPHRRRSLRDGVRATV